jgi:hypothetical protein
MEPRGGAGASVVVDQVVAPGFHLDQKASTLLMKAAVLLDCQSCLG